MNNFVICVYTGKWLKYRCMYDECKDKSEGNLYYCRYCHFIDKNENSYKDYGKYIWCIQHTREHIEKQCPKCLEYKCHKYFTTNDEESTCYECLNKWNEIFEESSEEKK